LVEAAQVGTCLNHDARGPDAEEWMRQELSLGVDRAPQRSELALKEGISSHATGGAVFVPTLAWVAGSWRSGG